MSLYDNVKQAAKSKGYSINKLEQELGFARSYIGKFRTITPSADKIQKIADFLGVSSEYLMTGQDTSKTVCPDLTPRDERDIARSLDHIMKEIREGDDSPLYYNGVEIDEASLNLLENAIEFALRETKKENKVKYNPHKNKK